MEARSRKPEAEANSFGFYSPEAKKDRGGKRGVKADEEVRKRTKKDERV